MKPDARLRSVMFVLFDDRTLASYAEGVERSADTEFARKLGKLI